MNTSEPRTGYELAKIILDTHKEDAIETMLRCSHGTESDWLEFKAGMTLLPEDKNNGDTEGHLYWNYVKSIVAMINTSGGAFVIGVDNKHNPVPLSSCDPDKILETGDLDDYIRKEILDHLAPEGDKPQQWTDKKGVVWKIDDEQRLRSFIEPQTVKFGNEVIVVLLVKPCDIGRELLVLRVEKGNEANQLPYRQSGNIGAVNTLSRYSVIKKYPEIRQRESDRFPSLFNQTSPALFVCHSSKDYKAADQFRRRLEEHGVSCWFAPNSIKGGNRWVDSIVDAITSSSAFLCLISRDSQKSPHVEAEIKLAFDRGKKIIPVQIDRTPLSKTMEYYLTKYQIITAAGRERDAADEVVASVAALDSFSPPPSPLPQPQPQSPHHEPTGYDSIIVAFRSALAPGPAGIFPIFDILKRRPNYNFDFPTFGGRYWWDTLAEEHGWKLQRNKFFRHIRILDNQNFRRAWGWRQGMERMFGIPDDEMSLPSGRFQEPSGSSQPPMEPNNDSVKTHISTRGIILLSKLAKRFRETTYPNEAGIAPISALLDNCPIWNRIFAQGGHWCWETITESNGWKLQRNKFFNQFRVRDQTKTCRACGRMKRMRLLFFPELVHPGPVHDSIWWLLWIVAGLAVVAAVIGFARWKTKPPTPVGADSQKGGPIIIDARDAPESGGVITIIQGQDEIDPVEIKASEWISYSNKVCVAFSDYSHDIGSRHKDFKDGLSHGGIRKFDEAYGSIGAICKNLTPQIVNNLVESAARDRVKGNNGYVFLGKYINDNIVGQTFVSGCTGAMAKLCDDIKDYERDLQMPFNEFHGKLSVYQRVYCGARWSQIDKLDAMAKSAKPDDIFTKTTFSDEEITIARTGEAVERLVLKLGKKEIDEMEKRLKAHAANPEKVEFNPSKVDCSGLSERLAPEIEKKLVEIVDKVKSDALSDTLKAADNAYGAYLGAGETLRKATLKKPSEK